MGERRPDGLITDPRVKRMEETSRRQRRIDASCDFYDIMWKIIVQPDSHITQYGACAFHAGYLRLQTHTHNTYCFRTVTMVIRGRLTVSYTYFACLVVFLVV